MDYPELTCFLDAIHFQRVRSDWTWRRRTDRRPSLITTDVMSRINVDRKLNIGETGNRFPARGRTDPERRVSSYPDAEKRLDAVSRIGRLRDRANEWY